MAQISRSEFHTACVATGDLGVIEAYFAQDQVAAEVARVNAYFQDRVPSINIFGDNPADPWYLTSPPDDLWHVRGGGVDQREFLFTKALANGLTDVIEWFYGSARAIALSSTLAALLPFTCALAADENHVGVVEILLTSDVYGTLLNDTQKQQLLNDMLIIAVERNHEDVIDLLVAHGASANAASDEGRDHPLASCAAMGNEDTIATLIDHGAVVIGSNLLIHSSFLGNIESACELLRSGVDWGNHTCGSNPLHAAAEDGHADLVRIYLEEGFADVDARNARGETALMMATWHASVHRQAVGPLAAESVTCVLIDCGADIFLQDADGRTALHHAIRTEYTSVIAMLLDAGLDPNERNLRGERAIDLLRLANLDDDEEGNVARHVELLLAYGTDLVARGPDGQCALDHLQATNTGRALLAHLAPTNSLSSDYFVSDMVDHESIAKP